jgi:hypothetical protein
MQPDSRPAPKPEGRGPSYPASAIQTLAIETNHEDLKDLKEKLSRMNGGQALLPL